MTIDDGLQEMIELMRAQLIKQEQTLVRPETRQQTAAFIRELVERLRQWRATFKGRDNDA